MTKLQQACNAWLEGETFRAQRERLKRLTFGDQWSDTVVGKNGNGRSDGRLPPVGSQRPVSLNMLRRLVRLLIGRFRADAADRKLYDLSPGSYALLNSLPELDARLLEEFIISGCAVQRVTAERRPDGAGIWIDNVSPGKFFVNKFTDPRGSDIDLVGMLHDMTWPQIVNRFGRGSRSAIERLFSIFNSAHDSFFDTMPDGAVRFLESPPGDERRMRVVELWSLDAIPAKGRTRFDMEWRCRFFAPDGTELSNTPSNFPHGGHPFVVKLYPLIDGEVHSFIEDLVERQLSVNRLLTTFEATIAASAKGALLFPVDQLVKGFSFEDIGALWARPDSVIPVSGRGLDMPHQLIVNHTASGIVPLIEMQLKLFEESSGVSDALMGRNISSAVGSELYKSLVANADAGIADILETFRSFLSDRNAKAAATQKYKI